MIFKQERSSYYNTHLQGLQEEMVVQDLLVSRAHQGLEDPQENLAKTGPRVVQGLRAPQAPRGSHWATTPLL